MARIRIPKNAGQFSIGHSAAGAFIVSNGKSGGNRIIIPCKTYEQAVKLCETLNKLDSKLEHEIWL
jgi:hypothetical protein